jgi:hypothetical protein
MPDSPAPDLLDDRLRTLARALADEAPPAPVSLDDLHAGVRGDGLLPGPGPSRSPGGRGTGSRWRPGLLAAAAVVAVAGVVGATVLTDDDGTTDVEAGMSPSEAPQRLDVPSWPGEIVVDEDGTVRPEPFPTAGFDPQLLDGPARLLDDGRTVAIGAVPGPDGTEEGLTHVLRVADEDGNLLAERVLDDGDDGQPRLLAATADEALLVRSGAPRLVVAHDLATGEERTMGLLAGTPHGAETSGDRLAFVTASASADGEGDGERCGVEAWSLGGAAPSLAELPGACAQVDGLRPSPDGRRVAVAYQTDGTAPGGTGPGASAESGPELRLVVVDLAGGVVSDELLGHPVVCQPDDPACAGLVPRSYLGMAWQDDATLRVATLDLTLQPGFTGEGDAPDAGAVVTTDLTIPPPS